MSQRKRIIIEETNEVHLISELAKVVTDWVKDLRFTIEKDTDLNLTDKDKSATPQVYKYYLPKRENNKREEPITRRNVNFPVPDVIPLFPALVIRPSNGSADVDENSSDYEDVNIDICIFSAAVADELMSRDRFARKIEHSRKRVTNTIRSVVTRLQWLIDQQQG